MNEGLLTFEEWQREHATALAELQDAQRMYHRTVAATAFQGRAGETSLEEMRRTSLEALDAARVKLDSIRARRPQTTEAT
jgi:1,6-anhydro-N-acetylmuramate kinase